MSIKITSKRNNKISVTTPKNLNIKVIESGKTITKQPINVIFDGQNANSTIVDGGLY